MNDFEKELATLSEEGTFASTHAGIIQDPGLMQLREQIKKVMIPLLIKAFQLKLELSQSLCLPSRTQNLKSKSSPDQVTQQLRQLDKDLKMLMLWCQSSRTQIQKALAPPQEEQKSAVSSAEMPPISDAVKKSFLQAMLSPRAKKEPSALGKTSAPSPATPPKKRWWRSWRKR